MCSLWMFVRLWERKTLEGRPVRLVRLMLSTWVSLDIKVGMEVCSRPGVM